MRTFNSAEKGYNKQYATAYAVYMIAGSYFASCKTPYRIQNLYLHYAEMPQKKQYDCEARVINFMERLDQKFLREIASLHCDVLCGNCGEELSMVFYTGGFEEICCKISKNGRFELAFAEKSEKAA